MKFATTIATLALLGSPLATAAPVIDEVVSGTTSEDVSEHAADLVDRQARRRIPDNMDTTACMFYSPSIGAYRYEIRTRTLKGIGEIHDGLRDGINGKLHCAWNWDVDAAHDINDPQVKTFAFTSSSKCTYGAVGAVIRSVTGQSSDNAQCLISFDANWPAGTP